MVFPPILTLNADNPKSKLFELLGISENSSIDEDLSDGYEFMGGSRALNSYINKNAARLVKLMGGKPGVEKEVVDELEQEEEIDEIIEKKRWVFV